MTPEEENAHLWAEVERQRGRIAELVAREHASEVRLARTRRTLLFGLLAVLLGALLAAGGGLLIARSHGAFESRVTYWIERGQDCGEVQYRNGRSLSLVTEPSVAEQAVARFTAAAARCKAATLRRVVLGVDTDESETFVIEPWDGGGGCDVGLSYVSGTINDSSTREVQCMQVADAQGVLLIAGCPGVGDVAIPAP